MCIYTTDKPFKTDEDLTVYKMVIDSPNGYLSPFYPTYYNPGRSVLAQIKLKIISGLLSVKNKFMYKVMSGLCVYDTLERAVDAVKYWGSSPFQNNYLTLLECTIPKDTLIVRGDGALSPGEIACEQLKVKGLVR